MKINEKWDKTFPKHEDIEHQKVTFQNRYGIKLCADLYFPKCRTEKSPAIIVSGPFGAVKEQSSGLYAQTMAEHGFISMAFDPSYTGESSGTPRNTASPDIYTEDFCAAVDYLGLQPFVSRERIGVIGICGFGGFSLNAAIIDSRIKAVATSAMYEMSRFLSKGANDTFSKAQRKVIIETLSNQRWVDAAQGEFKQAAHGISFNDNGEMEQPNRFLPDELPVNAPPVLVEFFEYYRTSRGYHDNSINSNGGFISTVPLAFMNAPQLTYLDEISPRPILLITGEKAHSRYYSEDVYARAEHPKELIVVPDANHCDLYDRKDKIPFEKLAKFFKEHL